MEKITQNASRGDLIPVLLGLSPMTLETARSLYHRCSAVSHVFCGLIPFPLRFSVSMRFHRVGHTKKERLMLQALVDFSNQLGNADTILYLIPCTREYTEMIKQNRELLESRFVIAMPGQASLEEGLEGGSNA